MTNIDVLMDEMIVEINEGKGKVLSCEVTPDGLLMKFQDTFLCVVREKLHKAFNQGLEVAANIAISAQETGLPYREIAARMRANKSKAPA